MGRLPDLDEAKLSADQRRTYDEIKRMRGRVRGPFAVWLRNAELGECTLRLQDMFASRVTLERRLVQLMILVAARSATAQYAWFIHQPRRAQPRYCARRRRSHPRGRTPDFIREDERVVYDITLELNVTRSLSEANYQRGMAMFGELAMVELVSAIGFYSMVAMTLNAFDIQVPEGKKPLE